MTEKTVPATRKETFPAEHEGTREDERYLVPPVDIYETEEALELVADLPGVSKKELDVRVENDVLTIRTKAGKSPLEELAYQEFGLRNFFRQFELSEAVNQDKIKASLKHGVLNLTLPKAEKAKPKRIEVKC